MADDNNRNPNPLNPLGLPDLGAMLEQMQLPGIDVSRLASDAQKNVEAWQKANQTVAEGWQALARKQMEIFEQTMQSFQNAMTGQGTESSSDTSAQAREGFEQALQNMRELAEIAADSQRKAFDIMRARLEENMQGLTSGNETKD